MTERMQRSRPAKGERRSRGGGRRGGGKERQRWAKPGTNLDPVEDDGGKQPTALQTAKNPVGQLFNPRDLPRELVAGIDVEKDIASAAQIDPAEVILSWLQHKYPTVTSRQECEDVLSMQSDRHDQHTFQEIQWGGKLALLGYALPYFMQRITSQLHMKNSQFLRYLESFVAESTFLAYQNMDQILQGELDMLAFPADAQMCGFYVRTPVQIWDEKRRPVYTLPPWESRTQLLDYFVTGDVNAYVMRRNLEHGFECYVMFRGTSNEFNGIPQYGRRMGNTPVYCVPQYDPLTNRFYPEGSNSVPLFYQYYMELVQNIMPHVLQCLTWLQASDSLCTRVVVAGHSMGGAMTLACCYLLKHQHEALWQKCQFRSYAAPMSCNDAAVLRMEQWFIDSMQPNKFLEVINTDDFVNIQHLMGGKRGLKHSIHEGTNRVGTWLVSSYWNHQGLLESKDLDMTRNPDVVQRMLRIVQLYPEIALSAFMNGAVQAQIQNIPDQRSAAHRLGVRQEESNLWGSRALKETYNGTMKIFFCRRHIQWQSEYIGKSHSNYVDLNMNILWAPLRMHEDTVYRFYADHDLKVNNQLRVVGLFNHVDGDEAKTLLEQYRPPPYRPASLDIFPEMLDYARAQQRNPNIMDYERGRQSQFGAHSDRSHRLKKQ